MNRLAAALIVLFSSPFLWAQKNAPAPEAKTFIGSEMCGVCHEDIGKAFLKSPHEAVEKDDRHGFTGKACESCHGPGSKHAETLSPADIRNPSKISAAETDRVCMTCHNNRISNAGRAKASHAFNSISCTACHSVHAHGPDGLVARKPAEVNTLCERCHLDVKAAFALPFKHPVPQNAMTCVDCHNPHGTVKAPLLRLAICQRARLLQLPRRQARTFHLRTPCGARRRLRELPHAAWFCERENAHPRGGATRVPRVPCELALSAQSDGVCSRRRASCVPRSDFATFSQLHYLSSEDSRQPRG